MSVRRVDWPLVGGSELPAPRVSRIGSKSDVASVLTMAEELNACSDADTACRRVVEFARDRIGLERTAIFLRDGEMMRGTWGTGPHGETTDEHELTFASRSYEDAAHQLAESGTERWLLLENAPQIAHVGPSTLLLGHGWLALTPIRAAGKRLGIMFSDGALSHAPFSAAQHTQLAVLCSLFGAILERQVSAPPPPRRDVRIERNIRASVRQALLLIDEDLTRTTEQLAELLDQAPRQLGRAFRQDMGESLVTYRNRRRIERFFALADGSADGLLRAAVGAGFGSYAQFHRIFRGMFGVTPSEYLTGKNHPPRDR